MAPPDSLNDFNIVRLSHFSPTAIKAFSDQVIGQDYYSIIEIEDILTRSSINGTSTSLALVHKNKMVALRISYAPICWSHGKGQGLRPDLWPVPMSEVAYFQSLFLAPEIQGQGWGQRLSEAAIEILRGLKARAVVCHSWVESPHDSSRKYLKKLGFQTVVQHPLYWKEINYVCTRCGKPCLCTAEEMIKLL